MAELPPRSRPTGTPQSPVSPPLVIGLATLATARQLLRRGETSSARRWLAISASCDTDGLADQLAFLGALTDTVRKLRQLRATRPDAQELLERAWYRLHDEDLLKSAQLRDALHALRTGDLRDI